MVYASGDFPKEPASRRAIELSKYEGFRTRQGTWPGARGPLSSASASANYVEGTGLGPFEGVTIRVHAERQGRGSQPAATTQGQGHPHHAVRRIVADHLGWPD